MNLVRRSKCLTDEAMEALAKQTALKRCSVSDCSQLTDAAVFNLAKHVPLLEEFRFATHSHGGYASSKVGLPARLCSVGGGRCIHMGICNLLCLCKGLLH